MSVGNNRDIYDLFFTASIPIIAFSVGLAICTIVPEANEMSFLPKFFLGLTFTMICVICIVMTNVFVAYCIEQGRTMRVLMQASVIPTTLIATSLNSKELNAEDVRIIVETLNTSVRKLFLQELKNLI